MQPLLKEVDEDAVAARWKPEDMSRTVPVPTGSKGWSFVGLSAGWAFLVVRWEHEERSGYAGTATSRRRGGLILALPPELAEKCYRLAEDYCAPTVKWFHPDNEGWNAPVNKTCARTETPKQPCGGCHRTFEPTDFGIAMPFIGGDSDPKEIAYHHHCLAELLGIDS